MLQNCFITIIDLSFLKQLIILTVCNKKIQDGIIKKRLLIEIQVNV